MVMVPGMTSHLEIQWRDPGYRRFMRSLSSLCRLVRFDKRGTGLSDPVAAPPTLDQRVADLKAVIAAARCRRPFVLGFSDGGPIAITMAADHRRSVRTLILDGTSPRNPPSWAMRQLRAMARQWGQGDSMGIFAPTLAGELARRDRAAFERASASPAMVRALVGSLNSIDVRSRLAEVAVPTLVVHRRSDILPFSHAKVMAREIKGAQLVELEGNDHLPWVGDANSVLSAIAEFVAKVSGYPSRADDDGWWGQAAAASDRLGGIDRRRAAGGSAGGRGTGQPRGSRPPVPVPVHGGDPLETRVRQAGRGVARGTCRLRPSKYLNSGTLVRPRIGKVLSSAGPTTARPGFLGASEARGGEGGSYADHRGRG